MLHKRFARHVRHAHEAASCGKSAGLGMRRDGYADAFADDLSFSAEMGLHCALQPLIQLDLSRYKRDKEKRPADDAHRQA